MAAPQDVLIALLAKTDGRDKLLKAAAGVARMLFHFTNAKQHETLFKSISDGRSLMRLVLWTSNVDRMVMAGSPKDCDTWLTFLRTLFDALFCVCDNVVYFGKPGVLALKDVNGWVLRGTRFMFFGFILAVVLDLLALSKAAGVAPSDATPDEVATFQKKASAEITKRRLMLVRNTCDLIASMNASALIPGLQLSHLVIGFCAFTSGAIASCENLEATAKAVSSKAK